jgi:hypothetical protein
VLDEDDNCRLVVNPDQTDTNQDGFGNLCDGDFNDDGAVATPDLGLFREKFGFTAPDPGYDEDFDLDSNGAVGTSDFGIFRSAFSLPPGPSGLDCAGTPPCPLPPPPPP